MWRLIAIGAGWVAGLAVLAVTAWLAVHLGVIPALAVGLVAGLAIRSGWRRSRAAVGGAGESAWAPDGGPARKDGMGPAPHPAPAPRGRGRRSKVAALLAGAIGGAGVAVALTHLVTPPVGDPAAIAPVPGAESIYRASGELGPGRNALTVRDRYAVAVAELQASPDLERPDDFRPAEGRFFVPEGWEGELVRDSVVLTRTRVVQAPVSLFRPSSIVSLDVPRISYLGLVLWVRPGSRVELDLPRHFLVATFPPSESTVDLVDALRRQRTSIPVVVGAGDSREVRLRVLHPALRNGVGEGLTRASILAPVKWAVLALVAIFAEQIKRRLLVPLAGRTAALLRIPLFPEEEKGGG